MGVKYSESLLKIKDDDNLKYYVVFTPFCDLKILNGLKKGFKHCYILIERQDEWISLDPLFIHIDIRFYQKKAGENCLPQWLRQEGCHVVHFCKSKDFFISPPGIFHCVSFAKRLLGIKACFIQTPWQLYRFLQKKS